jgi:HPt (histidine-containing phosphotransfer) domain-containing protein
MAYVEAGGQVDHRKNPAALPGHKIPPFTLPGGDMDGHAVNTPTAALSIDTSILNITETLERVEGDLDLLKELVDLFLEETPKMLRALENAITAGDPTALQHAAHTFKGSVSNFAAPGATSASFTLEKMGRQQDMSNVSAAFAALKQELERLLPVLISLKEKEAA